MNRLSTGRRNWILSAVACLVFIQAVILGTWPLQAQDALTTQPQTQISASGPMDIAASRPASAASQEVDAKALAATLQTAGLKDALAGRFEQGLGELRKAIKLSEDSNASTAVSLLDTYMSVLNKSDSERTGEYNDAVKQVERCLFAQAYLPKLAEQGLDKKLRLKVMGYAKSPRVMAAIDGEQDDEDAPATSIDTQPASTSEPASQESAKTSLAGAFNRVTLSEAFSSTSDAEAAEAMKKKSVDALQETLVQLDEALAIAKEDAGEYAQRFEELAGALRRQLDAYLAAWQSIQTDENKTRSAGAKQLKKIEDDLIDSLGSLEALVIEKPWASALTQARVALQLWSENQKQKVMQEPWYRQLVGEVEKLGKEYMDKSDWYEAMAVYGNLQELEPNNESYKSLAKTTQRHVRVLGLYGQQKPATKPAPASEESEASNWQDLVSGVDMEMVRDAIRQLGDNYVEAPDYHKLARGGLMALKVLAQTPQASHAFAGLGDAQKRQAFLDALEGLSKSLPKRENDANELILIMNSAVRSSERTVGIANEVVAVEFMDGLLEELDKFSNMIWPHEVSDFDKQTMGQFFGVGIQIAKDPGEPLKVVSPLEDSPAYKAGIKSGDFILTVDGLATENQRVDSLVKRITGPKGTKVVLRIKSPGQPPRDIELVREEIRIKTVKGWQRKDGGEWDYLVDPQNHIGYIRITQFTDQTAGDLVATLKDLKSQGCHDLIIDMRFNPGGLLRSAEGVCDEFLRDGRIVSTKGRQTAETVKNATPSGDYQTGNLIVLVNQYSASAAEIVAGALKDRGRAMVVGQRSYGKGSVQNVIRISRGKAILKATTAYYYLPSGRCLHRKNGDVAWGVDPDVEVLMTPRQTKRWLEIRRKTDLLQDFDPQELKQDMAEQYSADLQLDTAVLLLQLMQLKGEEVRVAG